MKVSHLMLTQRRGQHKQTEEVDSGGKASVAQTGMVERGRVDISDLVMNET